MNTKDTAVRFAMYLNGNFSWDIDDYQPNGEYDFSKKETFEKLFDEFLLIDTLNKYNNTLKAYEKELSYDPDSSHLKFRIEELKANIEEINFKLKNT